MLSREEINEYARHDHDADSVDIKMRETALWSWDLADALRGVLECEKCGGSGLTIIDLDPDDGRPGWGECSCLDAAGRVLERGKE